MPNRRLASVCVVLALLTGACSASADGGPTVAGANHPSVAPRVAAAQQSQAGTTSPSTPAPSSSTAAPNPCAGNHARQLVRVSLHRQHLWMCHRTRLVEQTAITSGIVGQYTHTPRGTFHIQARERNTSLTLNTGQQYEVKYWIPFDAPLFGFHDASWQKFPYGSAKYRTHGSHGCVHMPVKAISFLYRWADVGATVVIKK